MYSHSLKQNRQQQYDAGENRRCRLPAEQLGACGNHGGVLHKRAYERRGEQTQHSRQHQREGGQKAETEAHQFLHFSLLSGAVEIPEQRYAAKGESGQNQLGDHVDLQHNAHGGDFIIAVGQKELIDDDDAQALHEIAQCRRNTYAQDLPQLLGGDAAQGEPDRQAAAFFVEKPEEIEHAAKIADHCRHGRAHGTHASRGDENWVQNNVNDSPKNRPDHGFGGHALATDEAGVDKAQHHNGRADHQYEIILTGMGKRVGIRAQQSQNWAVECRHNHSKHNARSQGDVKAEGADALRALPVPLAKQPGNQRAAALTVDVAKGHQRGEHRSAQGDSGNQIRIIGLGNEERVRQIVNQCDDHSQHYGKRHPEIAAI